MKINGSVCREIATAPFHPFLPHASWVELGCHLYNILTRGSSSSGKLGNVEGKILSGEIFSMHVTSSSSETGGQISLSPDLDLSWSARDVLCDYVHHK